MKIFGFLCAVAILGCSSKSDSKLAVTTANDATMEQARRWLAEASSQAIWDRNTPGADFDQWLAGGKKIPGVESPLRGLLERRDSSVDLPLTAYALGFIGNRDSVPVLIDALKTDDLALRMLTVVALGELRDSRAIPQLAGLFQVEKNANVRANIVTALGKISSESLTCLRLATQDPDGFVSKLAKETLATLSSKEGKEKPEGHNMRGK